VKKIKSRIRSGELSDTPAGYKEAARIVFRERRFKEGAFLIVCNRWCKHQLFWEKKEDQVSFFPHLPQNFAPGRFGVPQPGHADDDAGG
jgi:hypothetical protein